MKLLVVRHAIAEERDAFAETGKDVDLKKGGACLLDLGDSPERGRAELLWLLTAAQLRWLAD